MAALNRAAAAAAASGVLHAVDHFVPLRHGRRLFAREWRPPQPAKATPIVLLHDSLGSVELWRGFPAALVQATGRQVVAYDRLGFGRSDVRDGVLPPTFIKEEAEHYLPAVFDHFRLSRAVLFGHSVGGAMAAACASRHPEACAAVVTEGAPAFVEDRTVRGLREAKANFQHAEQLDRLKRYHGEKARWVVDAWTETWLGPVYAAWHVATEAPAVACPFLVLQGDSDEYGSMQQPEAYAKLSRGPSQLVVVRDCGHVPHREQPDAVLAAVTDFLGCHVS